MRIPALFTGVAFLPRYLNFFLACSCGNRWFISQERQRTWDHQCFPSPSPPSHFEPVQALLLWHWFDVLHRHDLREFYRVYAPLTVRGSWCTRDFCAPFHAATVNRTDFTDRPLLRPSYNRDIYRPHIKLSIPNSWSIGRAAATS